MQHPHTAEVGTNFAAKQPSLSRYNSLADSGRGAFLVFYIFLPFYPVQSAILKCHKIAPPPSKLKLIFFLPCWCLRNAETLIEHTHSNCIMPACSKFSFSFAFEMSQNKNSLLQHCHCCWWCCHPQWCKRQHSNYFRCQSSYAEYHALGA
jgi:hypothetical protein